MVSSKYLYSFDMERVASGEMHTPGSVEVGEMKQEGHGSRYLDVGGSYIVSQANLAAALSIVDISDTDCLGRTDSEACPRALVLHDTFDMARGIVYARPPGYESGENNRDGSVNVKVEVSGVTDVNKLDTCKRISNAMGGHWVDDYSECTLDGTTLNVKVMVPKDNEATAKDLVADESFLSTVEFPTGTSASSIETYDDSETTSDDSDDGTASWLYVIIVLAVLLVFAAVFYVYKYQTVIVMTKEAGAQQIPQGGEEMAP